VVGGKKQRRKTGLGVKRIKNKTENNFQNYE
jgi:hypothetical protein